MGEQEAGGVANHALVLPTKPVYCDGDGCEYGGGLVDGGQTCCSMPATHCLGP